MQKPKRPKLVCLRTIHLLSTLVSLLFVTIGIWDIDNYFNWGQFLVTMIVSGAICGFIAYFALRYFIEKFKIFESKIAPRLLGPLLLLLVCAFIGAGELINKASYIDIQCKDYLIQDLSSSGGRLPQYFVFINDGERTERLSFKKTFNNTHSIGSTVPLCVLTGSLGFKYYKVKTDTLAK
jgi:hypothetical protein